MKNVRGGWIANKEATAAVTSYDDTPENRVRRARFAEWRAERNEYSMGLWDAFHGGYEAAVAAKMVVVVIALAVGFGLGVLLMLLPNLVK